MTSTRSTSLGRRTFLVGVLVTLWVLPAAAARATDGARTTADEPHYLMTAISLGEDLDLDVSDERQEQRYRPFHETPLLLQAEVRDDGSRISPHDPGLPALLALPVRLGGWMGAKLALAVLGGSLAAATLWVAVRRFGVDLDVATAVVLATAAAAPLALYSTQVYPEIAAALAVVGAIGAVCGPARVRSTVLLAGCLVALAWLGVKYLPVAAVLGILGLARLRNEPRLAGLLGAITAVAAVAYVVGHDVWYGGLTPYASGSHFVNGELTVMGDDPDYAGRSIRLVGLLADRSFGLLAWQPLYLAAVPALGALLARRPRGWATLASPLVTGWLVATFAALTMHGWWFPGRQVVSVLPAAVIAIAWLVNVVPKLRAWVVAAGLLGASLYLWLVAEALTGRLNLVVTFESLSHPWWRLSRWLLPDYRDLDGPGWVAHGLCLVAIVVLFVAGSRVGRRSSVPSGLGAESHGAGAAGADASSSGQSSGTNDPEGTDSSARGEVRKSQEPRLPAAR